MRPNLRFENFELDPGAYRLRQNGAVVHLERIPFELLCLLVERGGEIVTREEILERVWGKGVFVDGENSINTAVRKIRRALNDDADSPRFVVTIPAKGYRFIAPIVAPNGELKANGALADALPQIQAPLGTAPEVEKKGTRKYLLVATALAFMLSLAGLTLTVGPSLFVRHPSVAPRSQAWISPQEKRALPLPSIPSIAVLPFTNLSGDPHQEYFSDGITDDLITNLSRIPGLFVIARSSTFTYKGKATRLQDVGRDLGVRYVLEGSVRRTGDQLRITAELAEAETGTDIWAQSYDRPLRDIFSMQDLIVRRILTTLKLQLNLLQRSFPTELPHETDNVEAYDFFLRGAAPFWSLTREGMATAREMDKKAIELDPKYSYAYAGLGFTYVMDFALEWDTDPKNLERAADLANKAIALNENNAWGYYLLSQVSFLKGRYPDAIAEAKKGISINPNDFFGYERLADPLIVTGRLAEALQALDQANRLDPIDRDPLFETAWVYARMRRYQDAVAAGTLYLDRYPNNWGAHLLMVGVYSELGDNAQARDQAAEVARLQPAFSLKQLKPAPGQSQDDFQRGLADLRRAGLK